MANQFRIEFVPSGRGKAQNPPDPAYPHGVSIDTVDPGKQKCKVLLPYPAPECGHFLVECQKCLSNLAITAAGRPDDPVTVTLQCMIIAGDGQHRR